MISLESFGNHIIVDTCHVLQTSKVKKYVERSHSHSFDVGKEPLYYGVVRKKNITFLVDTTSLDIEKD